MLILHDQNAKDLNNKRRRSLRLPHSAHAVLSESLARLHQVIAPRWWALPPTSFSDEVAHYYSRHKELRAKGPRPRLRTAMSPSHAEEQALRIDVALSFADLGQRADPLIKPILLYYACAQLCGVFSRAFFDWELDQRNHGLECNYKEDVSKTQINIKDSGQFVRIAVTCFLFSSQPSCFSPLVSYSRQPTDHRGPGELLENFGKIELGEARIANLTLDELANFDFGTHLQKVRRTHGFHKFRGLPATAFLLDVLTLFLGSSLARYDVLRWKQILWEGQFLSHSF